MGQVDDSFYAAVLRGVGAPVTPTTLCLCRAWESCEASGAAFNPWDTTMPYPGATDYNSVGVKNYATAADGISATLETLHNGDYGQIIAALRAQDAAAFGAAVDASPWGTGGVAAFLGRAPCPAPSQQIGADDMTPADWTRLQQMLDATVRHVVGDLETALKAWLPGQLAAAEKQGTPGG